MSISKTALLSILVACWIFGLLTQFHDWSTTLSYLVLSLLIVAIVAARRQYQLAYAKNRSPRRR
jgi:prolipoprotein diacylglyceryltransferase